MSISLMAHIWKHGPNDQGARFVLLAIADHANDDGVAYPSVPRIADKCCMSIRHVRRVIAWLTAAGWLSVERNAGPKGCNLYTVRHAPPGMAGDVEGGGDTDEPLTPCHPDNMSPPLTPCPPPLTPCHHPPDTMSPEPSYNHQEPRESAPARDLSRSGRRQKGGSPVERGTLIGDWRPNAAAIAVAAARLHGDALTDKNRDRALKDAHSVAERFIMNARDKGRMSQDWEAAWMTWVSREEEMRARKQY